MTAHDLMQLVLRMQAQARQLSEGLATYEGWQYIPGENAAYCVAAIESIGQSLTGIRDTLREEMQTTSPEGMLYCPNDACDVREIPIEETSHRSGTGTFHCPRCDTLLRTPRG